jgi:hypothetical protein
LGDSEFVNALQSKVSLQYCTLTCHPLKMGSTNTTYPNYFSLCYSLASQVGQKGPPAQVVQATMGSTPSTS